jgi:hypothetical protein
LKMMKEEKRETIHEGDEEETETMDVYDEE